MRVLTQQNSKMSPDRSFKSVGSSFEIVLWFIVPGYSNALW